LPPKKLTPSHLPNPKERNTKGLEPAPKLKGGQNGPSCFGSTQKERIAKKNIGPTPIYKKWSLINTKMEGP